MKKLEAVDPHYGRLAAIAEARLIGNAIARNGLRIAFPPVAAPDVSIVVVSLNARDLLTLTLYRLATQQAFAGASFEVIVVDNASDAETLTVLDLLDGATVVRNAENVGYGPACNQGAAAARGRYLLFLNPDVELMPGALGALVAPFSEATVGIVGAHLVFPGGYLQESGAFFRDDAQITHPYGRGNPNPLLAEGTFQREVGYVSGAVLMIERALFEDLGGFDDLFAPAYFEDTDLCVRCHQAGRRVIYQPRASAIHFENATTPVRAEVEALIDRNRVRFLERHRSWLFPHAGPRFGDRTHNAWALKVLYIDDGVPHIDLGAGMPRANFIVATLARLGYQVTVYPVYRADPEIAHRYRDLPDTVEILDAEEGAGLARLIDERQDHYDVLWVSRPHNIDLVCQIFQNRDMALRDFARSRVIFDSEALFCLRAFLEATLRDGYGFGAHLAASARRETRNFAQADHVVCVSEAEARLLQFHGVRNTAVLGHAFASQPEGAADLDGRSGFVFIGSLEHENSPNVDSLIWFLETVWPEVHRALPRVPFTIIGQVTPDLRARLSAPNVAVMGRVPDPTPLLDRARVFVAPTRFAAGMPHKVHAAVAQGLPCLLTPILAEQLGWPEGSGYLTRDWRDPDAFIAGLIELHEDAEAWRRLQRAGLAQVAQDCSPVAYAEKLRSLCEAPVFA
ncbi:glycosyltransferase [Methylobacterium oryzae]|uniref:glycosyltransferase n=1 Tax=Methylobacterium oryzae TaxID=334852 RepID=UPI002F34AA19